ncbi:hypothetical protein KZ829_13655 [Actinoplanes hulinensis]|uniref:Uncharacterized protein n=1 Tax=Actinoplanes hulinensis TaxID=1144547 RepID=A0ABS7B2Y9_9ACTN|nr:hypothetical protein [Actinoplanes hulinensis]MBW6434784.1 hypothetical protein [Actinoplanes hulinensis]
MMRLRGTPPEPLDTIPYRSAARGGGTESLPLAVERRRVDALPDGCGPATTTR